MSPADIPSSGPVASDRADCVSTYLDDLRCRLRSFCKLHVTCDNAPFHTSRLVQEYLNQWRHWLVLHYPHKYVPEINPIERVWCQLHETMTRNHRCPTIDALLSDVYDWIKDHGSSYGKNLIDCFQAA